MKHSLVTSSEGPHSVVTVENAVHRKVSSDTLTSRSSALYHI